MTIERLDAAMAKAGYQRTDGRDTQPTWIRQEPDDLSAGELLRQAGVERIGRYDFERTMPGSLFHEDCGYLHTLHQAGECPDEATARTAFGDL